MEAFSVEPLSPFGAVVSGLNITSDHVRASTIKALEQLCATRGFAVLPMQSLPGDALVHASKRFGSGVLAARHVTHDEAVHEDVLRLSNREEFGVFGVGPQWHSDGSFERRIFSHVLFHAQQMPEGGGGGTELADHVGAFAACPPALQEAWSRLAIVNAYSGVVHPLVATHPLSGRRAISVHLGMVGAVLRWPRTPTRDCAARTARFARLEAMDATAAPSAQCGHELLGEAETRDLLGTIEALLSRPEHRITWTYGARHDAGGDLLIVDNLATAHRAARGAHDPSKGLRILHRTTVEGTAAIDPPPSAGLPPFVYVWGNNPLADGLWVGADRFGVGFRWNRSLPMRN